MAVNSLFRVVIYENYIVYIYATVYIHILYYNMYTAHIRGIAHRRTNAFLK